jgi:putative Mn2+ efflux pump MntP
MGFLLLGIDSLIACCAVGVVVNRRMRLPFGVSFGVCDAAGYLLGTALHWSMPDGLANTIQSAALVALGVYLIVVALAVGHVAKRWLWILPLVLSLDNITYGLIDGRWGNSVAVQAVEQGVSSALLALIGIAASVALARRVPLLQRHAPLVAGVGLVLAAPILLAVG